MISPCALGRAVAPARARALLALLVLFALPVGAQDASPTPPSPTEPAPAPALPDADPHAFHARADKAKVKLGEPFGYGIEIRHAPEEWYLLRGEPALTPFRAQGVRCQRELDKGEARTTCTMQLALFTLGESEIPALVFEVDRPAGKARLAVPGPRVTGVGILDPSVPPESLQLRDLAPPAPLLVRTLRPLGWALGALGAAALVALAVLAWRRRRARQVAAPPVSPLERFERHLLALEREELPRHGRGEEHVTRLSEAVREYLAALTGLPALDLTSAELLAALDRAAGRFDGAIDRAGLELFLSDADRVKFARRPADPELCAAGLAFGRGLLERTRPRPAVAVE